VHRDGDGRGRNFRSAVNLLRVAMTSSSPRFFERKK
jgi:hypothetical protein